MAENGLDRSRRNTWIGWRVVRHIYAPQCTVHRNMMGLYDMYAWAGNNKPWISWSNVALVQSLDFTIYRDQFDDIAMQYVTESC